MATTIDDWSPVIVTLECGHELDWRGPMMPSAQVAQVCMDCPVSDREIHPWRQVIQLDGYPSVKAQAT